MIKIYFNPDCPELIFSIAAIMASRGTNKKSESHLVAFIATYPQQMATEEHLFQEEIFLRAEDMVAEISCLDEEDEQASIDKIYEEVSSEDEIIVLNIHPINPEESAHLIAFFEKHQNNIKLWIDSSDYWEKGMISYLKTFTDTQVLINKDLNCLHIIEQAGIKVLSEWHAAAEAITRRDPDDYWSARYLAAISAARIIDENQDEEIKNYFYCLVHAVNEVWQGQPSQFLDELIQDLIESTRDIQLLKRNLETKTPANYHQIFPAALAAGRPIGYLNLKDINPALNLTSLLEYGTEKFPWLFLIYYNIGNAYGLLAGSKKLPIKIIEKRLADFSNQPEILLSLLEKEVINFKKKVIQHFLQ